MTKNIYNCAPKIWKKFSEQQKQVFNNFTEKVGIQAKAHQNQWAHPDMPPIDQEHYDTLRHNMACYAAWSVNEKTENTYKEV